MHSYELSTANPLHTTRTNTASNILLPTSITPNTMNTTHHITNLPSTGTMNTPNTMLHMPHPFPFTTTHHNPFITNTMVHMHPLRTITITSNITPNTMNTTHHTNTPLLHTPSIRAPFITPSLMNLPSQNFLPCLSLLENQRIPFITTHLNKPLTRPL